MENQLKDTEAKLKQVEGFNERIADKLERLNIENTRLNGVLDKQHA